MVENGLPESKVKINGKNQEEPRLFKAKDFQTMVHMHESLPSVLVKAAPTLPLKIQRITCLLKFTATLTNFFQVYLGTKIIKALLYVGCVN